MFILYTYNDYIKGKCSSQTFSLSQSTALEGRTLLLVGYEDMLSHPILSRNVQRTELSLEFRGI